MNILKLNQLERNAASIETHFWNRNQSCLWHLFSELYSFHAFEYPIEYLYSRTIHTKALHVISARRFSWHE